MTSDEPRSGGGSGLLTTLGDLDRRFLPVAAAALDRLVGRTGRRIELAPDARRILGALSLVLLGCAIALVLIGA